MHKANHCRKHRHQILLICTALSLLLCYSRCGSLNHSMVSGDRVQTTKIDLPLSISASPPGHCHPHPSLMIPRGHQAQNFSSIIPIERLNNITSLSIFCIPVWLHIINAAGLGSGAREMLVGYNLGICFPSRLYRRLGPMKDIVHVMHTVAVCVEPPPL